MLQKSHAFTIKYNRKANALITPTKISQAFDPSSSKEHPPVKQFDALWDTGATGSVISERVVKECGLQPVGMTKVYTTGGEKKSAVYIVNIILPNNVGISHVRVTTGILKDFDVLIGMDIISRGDFAVSNYNGNTTFNFRIPSYKEIDFKTEAFQTKIQSSPRKVGRNEPCPCGSGKKYKKCCGK